MESYSADLNAAEQGYIERSIHQRQAEQSAERKRRRNIYLGLAAGLVIALVLAGIAVGQWYQAEQQRKFALARQLAAQSELMRNEKVELIEQSVLLAVEAVKRSPAPILEAGQAIHHGLMLLPRPFKRLEHADSSPLAHTFSPDGKYLATGNTDGNLRLWEMPTGHEFATFKHEDPVRFVVFSKNEANVISVTSGNVISVWELATKRNAARLQFDGNLLGFIEDAKYIAIISPDNTVLHVLELSSGQEINRIALGYPIKPPMGPPVRLSVNGKYLATVDRKDANAALVWEVKSGQKIARLEHAQKGTSSQEAYINDIEFSPGSELLVTAGKNNIARLWEIDTEQEVGNLPHEYRVEKVVFSPDGKYLATITSNRNVQVWNLNDKRVVARLALDKPLRTALSIQSVVLVFSRDSMYLAIADRVDNLSTARVLSLAEGREVTRTLLADSPITIALSPDGKYFATRGPDNKTRLLEIDNGSQIARMNLFYGASEVAFSPDQKYLATASPYRFAILWNIHDGREVHRFSHNWRVESVAFSHDGKYLATGTIGGEARLWEIANKQELRTLKHSGGVRSVTFSPNGKYLATAGGENDKTAIVWATDTYDEVTRVAHASAVQKVTFSSDGKYIATASEDGSAVVWELPSGKEMIRLKHDQKVNAVAFSRDGDRLATVNEDGTARIWKLMDGREMLVIRHDGPVHSVAFSPDTRYLATAADKSIMIWDIARNQEWFRVTEGSGALAVAFSPDGKFLAAGSGSGVTVWLWRPTDLISEACQRLTRNLSRKEWEMYLGDESYQPTCPGLPVMDKD